MLEKGSFEKVELVVKQWHEKKTREEVAGGYVTKKWLMDNKSYTQHLERTSLACGQLRSAHARSICIISALVNVL